MNMETPRTDKAVKESNGQWSYALVDTCKQLERELVEARRQRDKWAYECEENMKLLKETIATATRAIEQRETLAEAIEFALNNALASGESENALRSALAAVKGGIDE